MSRVPRKAATTAYAVLVVGVIAAPALVFDAATARGGAARSVGVDLLVASGLVGVAYAAYLVRVLGEAGSRRELLDRWLSCLHGLVALALTASVLPAAVLHETAVLHARAADAEWPLLLGWTAVLLAAAGLADLVRRGSLRWLRAEERSSTSARVLDSAREPAGGRHHPRG